MVLVPSYNAEAKIKNTILGILDFVDDPHKIVVIDDGSTDRTSEIANQYQIVLLKHPKNMGKGAALKTGFQYALQQHVDWALTMDADGQHNAKYIPDFYCTAMKYNLDLLIGTRKIHPGTMPIDRYFSNQFSSLLLSLVCGSRIKDSQSGYRLIRLNQMKKIQLKTNHFETESELVIQCIRNGSKVGQIPISTVYRDESSSIRRMIDTYRFVRLLIKFIIKTL